MTATRICASPTEVRAMAAEMKDSKAGVLVELANRLGWSAFPGWKSMVHLRQGEHFIDVQGHSNLNENAWSAYAKKIKRYAPENILRRFDIDAFLLTVRLDRSHANTLETMFGSKRKQTDSERVEKLLPETRTVLAQLDTPPVAPANSKVIATSEGWVFECELCNKNGEITSFRSTNPRSLTGHMAAHFPRRKRGTATKRQSRRALRAQRMTLPDVGTVVVGEQTFGTVSIGGEKPVPFDHVRVPADAPTHVDRFVDAIKNESYGESFPPEKRPWIVQIDRIIDAEVAARIKDLQGSLDIANSEAIGWQERARLAESLLSEYRAAADMLNTLGKT